MKWTLYDTSLKHYYFKNHGSNRLFLACELFNGEGDVSYSYNLNQAFSHSGSCLMAHRKEDSDVVFIH